MSLGMYKAERERVGTPPTRKIEGISLKDKLLNDQRRRKNNLLDLWECRKRVEVVIRGAREKERKNERHTHLVCSFSSTKLPSFIFKKNDAVPWFYGFSFFFRQALKTEN